MLTSHDSHHTFDCNNYTELNIDTISQKMKTQSENMVNKRNYTYST